MSRPLTILGGTSDGEVAFTFHPDDPDKTLTLGESDLIELTAAINRDYLPLWPQSPCAICEADAVATIDGRDYCEGHAMSYGFAEDESFEAQR